MSKKKTSKDSSNCQTLQPQTADLNGASHLNSTKVSFYYK